MLSWATNRTAGSSSAGKRRNSGSGLLKQARKHEAHLEVTVLGGVVQRDALAPAKQH
jgi:hypothetical protein